MPGKMVFRSAVAALAIGKSGMIKRGILPVICVVTLRTLSGKMIGWLLRGMTALTIGKAGMIKHGRFPGSRGVASRTLSGIMINRFLNSMAIYTIRIAGVVKLNEQPINRTGMTADTFARKMVGWCAAGMTALALCHAVMVKLDQGPVAGTDVTGSTLPGKMIGRDIIRGMAGLAIGYSYVIELVWFPIIN